MIEQGPDFNPATDKNLSKMALLCFCSYAYTLHSKPHGKTSKTEEPVSSEQNITKSKILYAQLIKHDLVPKLVSS